MEVLGTTSVPPKAEGLQGPVLEHIEVYYLTHADVMTQRLCADSTRHHKRMRAVSPRYYPLQNPTQSQARHQIHPNSHQPFLQMASASPKMEALIRDAILTARSRERTLTKPYDILVFCRILHRVL